MTIKFDDRYKTWSVPPSERAAKTYSYWVTGTGPFPVDMLRYDHCWPSTGEDVAKVMDQLAAYATDRHRYQVSLRLCSDKVPTLARWASFGWSVSADKMEF